MPKYTAEVRLPAALFPDARDIKFPSERVIRVGPKFGPPIPHCPANWGAYDVDFQCELIRGHEGMHTDASWGVRIYWEDEVHDATA